METFLDKIKDKIGNEIFLTPPNLVRMGVFSSNATVYRAIKNKELSYLRQRRSIRVPTESVIEYLEKNFQEVKDVESKIVAITDRSDPREISEKGLK